ncbi:MAG: efflux RND transporter periplasmic adaptor subunit, partial [Planctomycetales bacterium]|nr:efflux RND transporter periplasmic adaptor subunit [Planctomycetales bacterium]
MKHVRWFLTVVMLLPAPFIHAQSPVRTAKVEAQSLQQRQRVTGSLRAVARGDIAALEAGRLIELTVREGDRIARGDVIARIDARRLEAQKAELLAESRVAQAELARTRAQGRLAASNLERKEKLIGQNAISRQELEQFQVASEVAQADIEAAERRIDRIVQSIALLDVRLSDTQIEAPYDASVVARHVEPGDWVAAGDPLLTLVSTGPIQAWLEVPERFADEISRFGDSVIVHSPSTNQSYKSTSTKRVADVNPRVRTLSFIATISNQDNRLAAGMSVDAWIASGEEQTYLTVPTDAVIRHASE